MTSKLSKGLDYIEGISSKHVGSWCTIRLGWRSWDFARTANKQERGLTEAEFSAMVVRRGGVQPQGWRTREIETKKIQSIQ